MYQYFFNFHNSLNKQKEKPIQSQKNMIQKITITCIETIKTKL